ncbi:hypothetical protein FE257_012848 [Aspergillus nanangensis]|uniref:S-adenosyl-L-methionine-dependent methyltransferase n=1 Tax=Aspergillus nanangensis TaxID=2582783 RepID=A0AAD4GQI3_ASPNN|nr:hypothetical protein FE257_012848 [Aspergillus nanangensis]
MANDPCGLEVTPDNLATTVASWRFQGGKLYLSPITEEAPSVLDIATGDATWVLAFAEQSASASIVANNSSSMEHDGLLPPNITPEISDANETWTYPRPFDFIHCRQHHRRLDEQKLFQQAFQSLNPGGWIEMQELCNPVACDDGTLPEDSPLARWGRLLIEASEKMHRPTDNPTKYESWMREAGFVHCQTVVHEWPTNAWPQEESEKLKGIWNLFNVLQRLEEFTMVLLVKVLGWKADDVAAFLVDLRAELQNPEVHAYWPVYIVYGQKPLSVS